MYRTPLFTDEFSELTKKITANVMDWQRLLSDERVNQAIAAVRHRQGQATMVMLGQSVVATIAPEDSAGWQECRIDCEGTRYLT